MTVKQFLQSKIFRCIVVLLCIALVSGGLLAILNDLWSVSDEEIIQRGIKSVCGDGVSLKEIVLDEPIEYENGSVDQVLLLSTDEYLVRATGLHGFQEGTVSVYVLFALENSTYTVKNVVVADYASSQTLMSKITAANLAKFIGLTDQTDIDPKNITSGASKSSRAIKNGVNCAIEYMKTLNGEG